MPLVVGATTKAENASAASVSLAKPAGTLGGDLLIAVISHASPAAITTPATGMTWTLAASVQSNASALSVFYGFSPNEDATSYSFPTATARNSGILTRISGALVTPIDVTVTASTGASTAGLTLPGLTLTSPNELVFSAYSVNTAGATAVMLGITDPWEDIWSDQYFPATSTTTVVATTTGAGQSLAIATEPRTATGATGPRTYSFSPNTTAYAQTAIMIGLRPGSLVASRSTSWTVGGKPVASRATTWAVGGKPVSSRSTTWETRQVMGFVRVSNPSAATGLTHWQSSSGVGGVSASSAQATGGPFNDPFHRQTWSVSQTGTAGNAGTLYSTTGAPDPYLAVNPGQLVSASAWVRSSVAQRIGIYVQYLDASSATLGSTATQYVVSANTWTFVTHQATQVAPAGTVRVRILTYSIAGAGSVLWSAGDTLDTALVSASSAPATRSTTWTDRTTVTRTRITSWSTFSQTTTTTFVPGARLVVYAPVGAKLGVLPAPQAIAAAFPLNDLGSLSFSYLVRAPRSSTLLGQACEVALELSPDNGRTWFEPPDGRFLYTSDGRDPIRTDDRYEVTCTAYVKRLEKVVTYPNGVINEEGKREFLARTPGWILNQLFTEAQQRGAMSGITWTFTPGADSAGVPWTTVQTVYYDPGVSALMILMNMAEQEFIDFRMQGRTLHVFNNDQAMAADRTVGAGIVNLRSGRDLTEAPYRRTWEGMADSAYFQGDAGASYQYTNPGAETPFGRQEIFIANGSVSDPGTMAAITQATLSLSDAPRIEYTRGLDFTRSPYVPFTDYRVGDYVYSTVDGTAAPERLRVRQVTITVSDLNVVSGGVVLNDRFLERDVRAQRQIDGITNGASGAAPLPGGPGTGEDDKLAPGQVTGLVVSSAAYLGPGGFVQAAVALDWAEVTINADATPADDIDRYEIYQRQNVAGQVFRFAASTPDTGHEMSPYVAGASYQFQVRAVDQNGNRGAFSAAVTHAAAIDVTPPQAPAAPVGTQKLGTVEFTWNGLPATGSWPPDFDYVEVHTSTVNNFTPTTATLFDRMYGAGSTVVTDGAFGVPIYCKLIAVDKSGLKSTPSTQGIGTPARLVGTDLDPGAITYEQIGFKDPGNLIMDGSFETSAYRNLVEPRSNAAWTFTTGDKFHGTYAATVDASVGAGTSRNFWTMVAADAQQIKAGDKLFARFAYKGTVGGNGTPRLIALWNILGGTTSFTVLTGSVINGTWQQGAMQMTAPANTVSVQMYLDMPPVGTVGTYWVDAVEVRRTVGTAIIEDAAIGNAQIANLAVNDAKIMNLDVGKITTGQLNATVLIAGTLRTASAGARLELTGTGMRLFDAAGALKGWWDPASGKIRIYSTTDASHISTGHGIQFGDDTGPNLIIDNNEIMTRFNGDYSELLLNREGGGVRIGGIKGGLAEVGEIPDAPEHIISLRGNVLISNIRDADFYSENPPLMIGRAGQAHLFFDSNEIGSALGDVPSNLYLNAARNSASPLGNVHHNAPVVLGSASVAVRRGGTYADGDRQGFIYAWDSTVDVGMRFQNDRVYVVQADNTGTRPITASAFTLSSEEANKEQITEFDPWSIIRNAPSSKWQYKDRVEKGNAWHFGPMVEALPEELVHVMEQTFPEPASKGYDLGALMGILWAAVRDLDERTRRGPDK
jgi:hypothetical protein